MLKYDIVIRSYYKDFSWLRYALLSIQRNCRGFSRVVLVVPESSRPRLDSMGLAGDVTITCPDYKDDYLGQQVTKLTADRLTDADYICHIDSDCVFCRRTTPDDFFESGKPVILMTQYSALDPHVPWKGLTEKLLRHDVHHEFMRNPPYIFPRWIYGALREYVLSTHGIPLEDYILAQPFRGFSEFNALGAYAWHYHRDQFVWREVGPGALDSPCRAFWSWGGIDDVVECEMKAIFDKTCDP
jgi:hypothetical protein